MAAVKLALKVVPGASRDDIIGWLGDALKISVRAPPEKGRANSAVVRLLEARLGLDRGAVALTGGEASPYKTVSITGIDRDTLMKKVSALQAARR